MIVLFIGSFQLPGWRQRWLAFSFWMMFSRCNPFILHTREAQHD